MPLKHKKDSGLRKPALSPKRTIWGLAQIRTLGCVNRRCQITELWCALCTCTWGSVHRIYMGLVLNSDQAVVQQPWDIQHYNRPLLQDPMGGGGGYHFFLDSDSQVLCKCSARWAGSVMTV